MKFISASPAPDYQNGYCGISLNIKKGQEAVGEIYVKLKYLGKQEEYRYCTVDGQYTYVVYVLCM